MRSLFFVPANRTDLIAKLARFAPDCGVLDLEDGTPPSEKDAARAALPASVATVREAGFDGRLLVRVNEPRSAHHVADVRAALASGADGVLVPKLESRAELDPVLEARGATKAVVAGGIESMRGVLNVEALCGADTALSLLYFGAEDFAADLGAQRTEDGTEVLYARSRVVLAAKAAGVVAIDQAVADVRNDALFARDARTGRNLGYDGKICVIPRQVPLSHEAFSPSPEEVETATGLVAAYARAEAAGIGTIEFEGQLIDGPMVKRAQRVLALAQGAAR